MKITCGVDIIEISRIKDAINKKIGENFIEKIYTKEEINYCESKKKNKYQHYAVRFAAKEAIFKAISKRLDNKYDIDWKQMEIVKDEDGRPGVKILHEISNEIDDIDISLSHCKEYAVANVVIIFK